MGGKGNSAALMAEIRKVRLSELEGFIQSESYTQLENVPVTPARAKSYIENPHGRSEDVVLIMAFFDDQIIAFRSLFAGMIQKGMERVRFGWCSGNWVHPEYRKKGLSQRLLTEAYAAWNGKLMFTNYAPESENLYLKTGWFHEIHNYDGARGYLFVGKERLMSITKNKKVPSFLITAGSLCTVLFAGLRVFIQNRKKDRTLQFEELEFPDSECYMFLHDNPEKFLFVRDEVDWNWIFRFPWITENGNEIKSRYPFSSVAGNFYYRTIKVQQKGMLAGFFIFSVREGHLKSLFFRLMPDLEKDVAGYIKMFAARQKLEMVTVYHSEIARYLLEDRSPFLFVKKYGQKIYSSFETGRSDSHEIRDSEGDYIFT